MSVTSVNPLTTTTAPSSTSISSANSDPAASQDRFLKLLVAQLGNQDPMNPMDNAQMTSQMAQINTVTGIQQLNQTMKDMAQQFSSLQVLQGASMVGRDVLTNGNTITLDGQSGKGAMDLAGPADDVKVDILSAGGQLVGSMNLGPQSAGRVMFDWTAANTTTTDNLTFRVTATQGGKAVTTTPLARDRVISVGSENGAMTLELQGHKTAAYSAVRAIL
jgi:flagellar basal-body rod modification protein FlgD